MRKRRSSGSYQRVPNQYSPTCRVPGLRGVRRRVGGIAGRLRQAERVVAVRRDDAAVRVGDDTAASAPVVVVERDRAVVERAVHFGEDSERGADDQAQRRAVVAGHRQQLAGGSVEIPLGAAGGFGAREPVVVVVLERATRALRRAAPRAAGRRRRSGRRGLAAGGPGGASAGRTRRARTRCARRPARSTCSRRSRASYAKVRSRRAARCRARRTRSRRRRRARCAPARRTRTRARRPGRARPRSS